MFRDGACIIGCELAPGLGMQGLDRVFFVGEGGVDTDSSSLSLVVDNRGLLVGEVAVLANFSVLVKLVDGACHAFGEKFKFICIEGYNPTATFDVARFSKLGCFAFGEEDAANGSIFGSIHCCFTLERLVHRSFGDVDEAKHGTVVNKVVVPGDGSRKVGSVLTT